MVAANFVSAVGQRFGRLLVVSEGTGKKRRVVAQCDCGTTKEFTRKIADGLVELNN